MDAIIQTTLMAAMTPNTNITSDTLMDAIMEAEPTMVVDLIMLKEV